MTETAQNSRLPLGELLKNFNYETAFVSSLHGFRANASFQQIVGMGEEAIPSILGQLQDLDWKDRQRGRPTDVRRSPWIALALDDITGTDVTGYAQLGGNIDAMTEKALKWGEAESYIEIFSAEERFEIGSNLLALLANAALSHPEAKQAMAESFTDEDEDVRTALFSVSGRKMVLKFSDGELVLKDADLSSDFELSAGIEYSDGYFSAPGAKSETRKAEVNFRQAVEEIFGPQTPYDLSA